MKLLIQRVAHAKVDVEGKTVGAIGPGLLVFLGVTKSDSSEQVYWLVNKMINLRIFEDAEGKMNQSILDQQGKILVISQFTLYADCSQGRRPSFFQAAAPEISVILYEQFIDVLRQSGLTVESGIFGAKMGVSLLNDGPVTIILEHPCL